MAGRSKKAKGKKGFFVFLIADEVIHGGLGFDEVCQREKLDSDQIELLRQLIRELE